MRASKSADLQNKLRHDRLKLAGLLREQYGISQTEADRQIDAFPRRHRLRADNTHFV